MFFTVEFKLFVHVPDFCSFCGIMAIFFQCLSIYWMVYPVVVLYSLCGYSLVKYWYITPCNHPQYPETRWWMVDISCKPGYSCMWGIHINLWFALVITTDFTFPESFFFWISGFLRSLMVDIFHMVIRDLSPWFQNENVTVLTTEKCLAKMFMFPSRNWKVLS